MENSPRHTDFIYVILDTTAVMADRLCTGIAWRILAAAALSWDVHVFVPEVAVLEAVAGYQRQAIEAGQALQAWADKHGSRLGIHTGHPETQAALSKASESYDSDLRDCLTKLGAAILPPADISHRTLVQRATSRRRPMNSKGDGYRDALNWLTVLSLAEQHPGSRVIWVSNNTRDFGAPDDPSRLHDHLIEDLTELDAHNNVSWVHTLQDLVLLLAAEHAPGVTGLAEIQATVQEQSLRTYVSDLIPAEQGRALDPPRCGLPPGTSSATIAAVRELQDIQFGSPGQGPGGKTIIQFSCTARTTIKATPLQNPAFSYLGIPVADEGTIVKPLMYSGIVTADEYGRADEGEITVVEAISDDPGLMFWRGGDDSDVSPELLATALRAAHPDVDFQSYATKTISPHLLRLAQKAAQNPSEPMPVEFWKNFPPPNWPATRAEAFMCAILVAYLAFKASNSQAGEQARHGHADTDQSAKDK